MTEFLLGMDFVCANDCDWLVSKGRILLKGPLLKCPHKANVRCNSIVVPADCAVTVPVKMPLFRGKKPDNRFCVVGPIPWGHSGPLCHALSLSSWTSMRRRRATVPVATPGEWA